MEEDIKVLEDMRDNIYGAMQFEDDYQVSDLEEKQFNALNLAIKYLRKTKLVKNNYIPKSKVREKIEELDSIYQQEIKQKYNGRYYHQLSYAIQILKGLEGDK